jgi:L-fucose isomerase-like protein
MVFYLRIEGLNRDFRRVYNTYPDMIEKIARLESALEKHMLANLGASQYAVLANKCWPAFEKYFGHVPRYVNSRLAAKGIPVACEADIYGALSEYILCAPQSFLRQFSISITRFLMTCMPKTNRLSAIIR